MAVSQAPSARSMSRHTTATIRIRVLPVHNAGHCLLFRLCKQKYPALCSVPLLFCCVELYVELYDIYILYVGLIHVHVNHIT